MTRQYKPDLSVRFAPRVPLRLRTAVDRICRANKMPEADVLRYSLEAAAALVYSGKLRLRRLGVDDPLDSMMTIRTSRNIASMISQIHDRMRADNPNLLHADVLRALLEEIMRVADKQGMASVLKLREPQL